jgi:hypothetical protein
MRAILTHYQAADNNRRVRATLRVPRDWVGSRATSDAPVTSLAIASTGPNELVLDMQLEAPVHEFIGLMLEKPTGERVTFGVPVAQAAMQAHL